MRFFTNSKKIVAVTMSVVMMLGFSTSAFAANSSINQVDVTNASPVISQEVNVGADGVVETQGFKRWFAEKAVKGIASALKAGASNKWVKKAIAEYFDDATAKIFTRNLSAIANELDYAVYISELSSEYISKAVYNVIYDVTGNYGISTSIADGVTALIDVFLL